MAAINAIISGNGFQQYPITGTTTTGVQSQTQTNTPAIGEKTSTSKTDTATFSKESLAAQNKSKTGTEELSQEEQQTVEKLKQTDREVRQHEQAHISAAGGYARGGAHFTYTTGPDGKRYATGGEVSIDVSPGSTPQATIQKMETVKRAALAPANPSGQDRAVYTAATREEQNAKTEAAKEKTQNGGEATAQSSAQTAGLLNIKA